MRKEGWRIVDGHLLMIHGKAEKDAAENVPATSNGCSSTSLQEPMIQMHATPMAPLPAVKMIMNTSHGVAPPDQG